MEVAGAADRASRLANGLAPDIEALIDEARRDAEKEIIEKYARKFTAHGRTYLAKLQSVVKKGHEVFGSEVPNFSASWTRDDENQFLQDEEIQLQEICTAELDHLRDPFEISARLFGCSALAILSPLRRLGTECTISPESSVWSPEFSKTLTRLLAHPLWQSDVKILTIALQFAVVCRTGDQRPWYVSNPTPCKILDGLFESARSGAGFLHDRHMELRRQSPHPSMCSNLLRWIGGKTRRENHPSTSIIYSVTLDDLNAVCIGLERCAPYAIVPHPSVKMAHTVYSRSREMNFPEADEMRALYRRAFLHEKRKQIVAARGGCMNDAGEVQLPGPGKRRKLFEVESVESAQPRKRRRPAVLTGGGEGVQGRCSVSPKISRAKGGDLTVSKEIPAIEGCSRGHVEEREAGEGSEGFDVVQEAPPEHKTGTAVISIFRECGV